MVQLLPSDGDQSEEANAETSQAASSDEHLDRYDPHEVNSTSVEAASVEASPDLPAETLGRRWALAIGGGGAALCLLGGLAFVMTRGDEPQVAQASPALVEESQGSTNGPLDTPSPETLDPEPESEAAPTVLSPDTELPELPKLPSVDMPPVALESVEEKKPKVTDSVAEDVLPPPPPAKQQPTIDPLNFDPASLDLVMLRDGREPSSRTPDDSEQAAREGTRNTKKDPETTDPEVERQASLDRRLAERAEIERVWVERSATAFEPHKAVDLARRLSERVPELVLPAAPLGDAVRLWGELAGVPVTIDPQALSRVGATIRTKVTLRGVDASLGELLLDGLKPLRLTFVEGDGQVVLAMAGGRAERAIEKDFADLLTTDANDADQLVRLAQALALDTRDTGGLTALGNSIRSDGAVAAYHDLTIFCERLRRARALPQQTKYPATLLPVRPALRGLEPALARETTFTFVVPTPMVDIVQHWREASGIEMLVDWGSVAQVQLGPRSLLRCSVRNQPWRHALDGVLSPLRLDWRAVDDRTIQILSRDDSLEGHESLEFYLLAQARTGDQVAERLRTESAGLPSRTLLHFDAPSATLLVRACGANQQFVYDWLLRNGLLAE